MRPASSLDHVPMKTLILHVCLNHGEDVGSKHSAITERQKLMELGRHRAKVTHFLTREVSGLHVLTIGDGGPGTENEPRVNIRGESPP